MPVASHQFMPGPPQPPGFPPHMMSAGAAPPPGIPPPPQDDEPPTKKQKTEDQLVSEEVFLARHKVRTHLYVKFKLSIFLPASPKAKAGLEVQSLRSAVRPSQNLVIATPLKLLIQLS